MNALDMKDLDLTNMASEQIYIIKCKHAYNYFCFLTDDNTVHIEAPITISNSNKITTLKEWGKSFVVDFFLHYSGKTFLIIAY